MSTGPQTPKTLADLVRQGVVNTVQELIARTVAIGTDLYESDIVSRYLDAIVGPVLPATFNALLQRIIGGVQAIWNRSAAEDTGTIPAAVIPLEPIREGKAGDFTDRFLYRTVIIEHVPNQPDIARTQYIDSDVPLTYEQVRDEAEELYEVFNQIYSPPPPDTGFAGTGNVDIVIEEVTRRY